MGLRLPSPWGFWAACLLGLAQAAAANQPADQAFQPAIALIIDDLGNHRRAGLRTVELPGRITCAFLPMTPHARALAELAHQNHKEVMLHLPMQSMETRALGPGGVTLDMTEHQFEAALRESIASVPHVRGLNNHMGSLLTRHPGHMDWLMQTLASMGNLYFVDSRTTHHTVAHKVAAERRVPQIQRDVFLDTLQHDEAYVRQQFATLLQRARKQGLAVGIAHPYTETLNVLEDVLKDLKSQNIQLLPVSELLTVREERQAWRASLSPSPKAAKN